MNFWEFLSADWVFWVALSCTVVGGVMVAVPVLLAARYELKERRRWRRLAQRGARWEAVPSERYKGLLERNRVEWCDAVRIAMAKGTYSKDRSLAWEEAERLAVKGKLLAANAKAKGRGNDHG